MIERRVVATGVGVASPLGLDSDSHYQGLLRGECAAEVTQRRQFRNFPSKLEAKVKRFDRRALIENRMLRKLLSDNSAYSVVAAGEAIRGAGLTGQSGLLRRCGLFVGSISVDLDPEQFIPAFVQSLNADGDFEISRFAARGMKLLDPLFLVKSLPNAGLCGITVQHQVLGPNSNITNGTLSSMQAIDEAVCSILRGECELALAGGYDSQLRMDSFAEHILADRLTKRSEEPGTACRPMDRTRDGYFLSEGAAFVMLEEASHARARSAAAYGEILAVTQTSDPWLIFKKESSHPPGLLVAAQRALRQADCPATRLGAVFGDGLATSADDLREAQALGSLDGGAPITFTASTACLGFTGAASGCFSLIHGLMSLSRQIVPPLTNCFDPDPECSVAFVPAPVSREYDRALIWNSDCGLKNAALVIGRHQP